MPMYTFKSPGGLVFRRRLSFADYEAVRAGDKQVVDDDDEVCELIFDPGQMGFVLKDGPSGGWASKASKENKYRRARSGEMARREKDNVFKSRLIPNLGGKEASTWKDVQDQVRTDKGDVAATTYDSLVAKEQQGA